MSADNRVSIFIKKLRTSFQMYAQTVSNEKSTLHRLGDLFQIAPIHIRFILLVIILPRSQGLNLSGNAGQPGDVREFCEYRVGSVILAGAIQKSVHNFKVPLSLI